MKKIKWQNIYLCVIFALLYLPIFYLIYYSFSSGDNMNGFKQFTFANYQALFNDQRMLEILLATLLVAFLSALCATIIGTFGAIAIYWTRKQRLKNTVLSLNNILMVSPDVIIGASFLIFFTFLGVKLGFLSVLLSHIAFSIPIVVLMVLPKLNEMKPALIDAAHDLGANFRQVLFKVVLPYISSGIFAGFFMAFTYSLDDFAVTFFVTGNGFETLSVEIYARARQGISLEINALSALMFLFALVLVVGYYFINQHNQRKSGHLR